MDFDSLPMCTINRLAALTTIAKAAIGNPPVLQNGLQQPELGLMLKKCFIRMINPLMTAIATGTSVRIARSHLTLLADDGA